MVVDRSKDHLEVLLVDDNEKTSSLMSRKLSAMGFSVEFSSTGRETIKKFKEKSFDVVLLDSKMLDISMMEVLREMKQINSMTKIIMLTGHGVSL